MNRRRRNKAKRQRRAKAARTRQEARIRGLERKGYQVIRVEDLR